MEEIILTIVSPDGNAFPESGVRADYTAGLLIKEMVDLLKLPRLVPRDGDVEYRLEHDSLGVLDPDQLLTNQGVKDGDTVYLRASQDLPPGIAPVPPAEPGQVTVNLNVLDANAQYQATFEKRLSSAEILSQLISQYNLQVFNPKRSQPYTYHLASKYLGRRLNPGETLESANIPSNDTLDVIREEIAGGVSLADARSARLREEYTGLMNLSDRGSQPGGLVRVAALNRKEGWAPEEYVVTFTCKGIVGIREGREPIYGFQHQVRISLSTGFPVEEPRMRWLTPIWHPNIEHVEPHHVCTNNLESWWQGRTLSELVMSLGEMVQYKRYHAKYIDPYPLDLEVARWVEEYAEPKGIVGKTKPVDDRPLVPTMGIRPASGERTTSASSGGVRLGPRLTPTQTVDAPAQAASAGRNSGGLRLGPRQQHL